jgi:hypothetical protein
MRNDEVDRERLSLIRYIGSPSNRAVYDCLRVLAGLDSFDDPRALIDHLRWPDATGRDEVAFRLLCVVRDSVGPTDDVAAVAALARLAHNILLAGLWLELKGLYHAYRVGDDDDRWDTILELVGALPRGQDPTLDDDADGAEGASDGKVPLYTPQPHDAVRGLLNAIRRVLRRIGERLRHHRRRHPQLEFLLRLPPAGREGKHIVERVENASGAGRQDRHVHVIQEIEMALGRHSALIWIDAKTSGSSIEALAARWETTVPRLKQRLRRYTARLERHFDTLGERPSPRRSRISS